MEMTTSELQQNNQEQQKSFLYNIKTNFFNLVKSKEFIYSVLFTFILSLVAHGFAFLNGNFSDDSLSELYNPWFWKIQIGRFISPIFFAIRGNISLPWVIGLLGTAWMSLAVYTIIKTFNIKSKLLIFLIAGIIATNLTTTSTAGTYIQDFDVDMFSLFCAVLAVFCWHHHSNWKGLLIGTISCLLSLGAYQGYIVVTITLIIIISIINLIKQQNTKLVIIEGLKSLGMIIVGFLIHNLISNIICLCFNTSFNKRVDIFWAFTSFSITFFTKPFTHFVEVIQKTTTPNWITYTIFTFIILTIIYIFIKFLFSKSNTIGQKILASILIIIMPYAMDMFNLFTAFSHDLMIPSFWIIPIFALILVKDFNPFTNSKSIQTKALFNIVTAILVGIFIWGNIITANTLHLKKDLEQKSTLFLMTRVVSEMEDIDGYITGETPVLFIGVGSLGKEKTGFEDIYPIMGAWHNYAITMDIYGYYELYFEYVLNYPIILCDETTRNSITSKDIVKDMPTFPEQNSVQMIDNILVVKL